MRRIVNRRGPALRCSAAGAGRRSRRRSRATKRKGITASRYAAQRFHAAPEHPERCDDDGRDERPRRSSGATRAESLNQPALNESSPDTSASSSGLLAAADRLAPPTVSVPPIVSSPGSVLPAVPAGRGRRRGERRGRRRRIELRLDDDALPRRVPRVARGERERRVGCRVEHAEVGRLHDLGLGHEIPERALHGRHDDLVAPAELVDAEERRAVGGAVPGDRGVAELPGQRRVRVVARALAKVGERRRRPRRSCRRRSSGSRSARAGRPPSRRAAARRSAGTVVVVRGTDG